MPQTPSSQGLARLRAFGRKLRLKIVGFGGVRVGAALQTEKAGLLRIWWQRQELEVAEGTTD